MFANLAICTPNTIDTNYGFTNSIDNLDVQTCDALTLVKPANLPGTPVAGQINVAQYGADVFLLMPNGKRVILKNFLFVNLTGANFLGGNVS